MADLRFDGKVAIVTGAGGGLGRQHALELARRGAKVVINDLGGSMDGSGGSSAAAEAVVAEIKAAGGEAIANGASVTDDAGVAHLVKQTMDQWGRIDVLIANAGIVGDRGAVGDRLAAGGLDLGDHGVGRGGGSARAIHRAAQVVDHHLGPAPRQFQRVLPPQAAARAGYDRHLAVETQVRHVAHSSIRL